MQTKLTHRRSGFMLFECLLAFSIFGIAVTGIVIALHRASELSHTITREQWVQHTAQGILKEAITTPPKGNSFAREETITIDPTTEARLVIEPLEITNKDDSKLSDLYKVSVTLYWDNDGTRAQQSLSITHYDKMFGSTLNAGGRR